jgi:nitrite reductase/ring-hydroxylating ferredoxin subunit
MAGEDEVFVARVDGKVSAVGNMCPHYECPLKPGIDKDRSGPLTLAADSVILFSRVLFGALPLV